MLESTSPTSTSIITLHGLRGNVRTGLEVGIQAATVLVVAYGSIFLGGCIVYGAAKGSKLMFNGTRNWVHNSRRQAKAVAELFHKKEETPDAPEATPASA